MHTHAAVRLRIPDSQRSQAFLAAYAYDVAMIEIRTHVTLLAVVYKE